MSQQNTQFTIRIDDKLKKDAQKKAQELGLGLGTIVKLFFHSFVSQPKVTFYLGDEEFDEKLEQMLKSKKVNGALKRLGKSL